MKEQFNQQCVCRCACLSFHLRIPTKNEIIASVFNLTNDQRSDNAQRWELAKEPGVLTHCSCALKYDALSPKRFNSRYTKKQKLHPGYQQKLSSHSSSEHQELLDRLSRQLPDLNSLSLQKWFAWLSRFTACK